MKRFLLALVAAMAMPSVAMACNPTAALEGGGGSVNYKSSLDGSSNCFAYTGLVDGSGAVAFPNAAALADATANPTMALLGGMQFVYNGTTWDRWRSVGTGIGKVDLSTVAGTAAVTGGASGLIAVAGPVASAGANADNPLKVGGVFNTTQPTVTNGQIVDGQYTARGGAIVSTGVDTFNVTVNAPVAAGTNVIGKTGIDQTTPGTTNAVQAIPGTTGGASTCYLLSTAATNSTNCKNTTGQVYMIRAVNTNASTIGYLRMYNLTTAPTCSSATGFIETIPIPANANGGGIVAEQSFGQAYSTGIGFCYTGGNSSTDNTNGPANTSIAILYK